MFSFDASKDSGSEGSGGACADSGLWEEEWLWWDILRRLADGLVMELSGCDFLVFDAFDAWSGLGLDLRGMVWVARKHWRICRRGSLGVKQW